MEKLYCIIIKIIIWGDWINGIPNGKGIVYLNGGDRYEGDVKKDKAYGKGIYYYNNRKKY